MILDTILRKEQSISRTLGDDPFALDGFGDCTSFCLYFFRKDKRLFSFLVGGPASVIGIGGDHSNLSNEKDHYEHVMSPFHRKKMFIDR